MDKIWAKFNFWPWPPIARYIYRQSLLRTWSIITGFFMTSNFEYYTDFSNFLGWTNAAYKRSVYNGGYLENSDLQNSLSLPEVNCEQMIFHPCKVWKLVHAAQDEFLTGWKSVIRGCVRENSRTLSSSKNWTTKSSSSAFTAVEILTGAVWPPITLQIFEMQGRGCRDLRLFQKKSLVTGYMTSFWVC